MSPRQALAALTRRTAQPDAVDPIEEWVAELSGPDHDTAARLAQAAEPVDTDDTTHTIPAAPAPPRWAPDTREEQQR
jgi:hypothetical protein